MVAWINSLHPSVETITTLTHCRTAHVHRPGPSRQGIAYSFTPVPKRNVAAFAKNSKRLKYSQADTRPARGEPLFIQVEPDASDAWRLDVVVDALKSGSVSARQYIP